MKRYIYIIIGIVVVAAIAILVLLYIKNSSSNTTATGTTGNTTSTGSLPSVTAPANETSSIGTNAFGASATATTTGVNGAGSTGAQVTVQKFGAISNNPVLDYFDNTANTVAAIEPTGAIITITNGQATTVNSSTIDNIISVSFSYDGKKVLVSFGNPADPQSSVFDLGTQTWGALPEGMQSPQWSPTSYKIAYLSTMSSGKLALSTLDASNLKKAPVTITTLTAGDLALQWPSNNELVLSDKPTAYSAGSIWAFNASAGTLTPLVYEKPGAEAIWSNNASTPYGLVFTISPSGQSNALELMPLYGSAPTETLNFITLPSKCTFSTQENMAPPPTASTTATTTTATDNVAPAATSSPYLALYCGIPRSSSGFSSARLPDDYNDMALFTSDDIYEINTATGATQVLWNDQTQNMDVSDMKMFNGTLFFINRYDQKLYGLTLAQ